MTNPKTSFALLLSALLCSGCSTSYYCCPSTGGISCISIIDRDGFTSTLQQADRIAQYANVNFLTPQSYQKVMVNYERDSCGNIPAFITSYYPNGQVKQYLELQNSRAQGEYREWHENGVPKLESHIIGGLGDVTEEAVRTWVFDGCCQAWDNCYRLLACIQYDMGYLEGESVYYYPSGGLMRRTPYCQGHIDGCDEQFTECGDLLETDHYVKGVREGPTRRYWSKDQLAAEENYVHGRLVSGRYYEPNGNLAAEIHDGHGLRALFDDHSIRQLQEYRHGVAEGQAKVFAPNATTTNIFHVRDGKKHGEEIVYFPPRPGDNGKARPKISINWYEDKIHGLVKSWYDNGVPESQKEMANNTRNGLSTAWYRDGSVMLMEEYDHDKLVKGEYYKRGERRPESRITDGSGIATLYDAEGNLIQKVHYYHGHILD